MRCVVACVAAGVPSAASSPLLVGPLCNPTSPISHVIPLGLFQDLNCGRWNCNVCGRSPKVTVGNYVRLLFSPGPAAAHQHRGQALRALRHPPHQWRMVADWWLGASTRCPARPRRRPRAPRPGPPGPPAPSTPVGLVSLIGASPRSPARPRHRPWAPQPGPPVPPAPSTSA